MLLTTTDTLDGYRVTDYRGLVIGQAVIGQAVIGHDVVKQFRTGIRNVDNGGRHDYANELARAREEATSEAIRNATALGADAVIGIAFTFETSGDTAHHVVVTLTGTAVRIASTPVDAAESALTETPH